MKLLLTLNWDELPEGKFRFSKKFGSTALIKSDRLFPSGKSPPRGKLGAPVNKSKQDWENVKKIDCIVPITCYDSI